MLVIEMDCNIENKDSDSLVLIFNKKNNTIVKTNIAGHTLNYKKYEKDNIIKNIGPKIQHALMESMDKFEKKYDSLNYHDDVFVLNDESELISEGALALIKTKEKNDVNINTVETTPLRKIDAVHAELKCVTSPSACVPKTKSTNVNVDDFGIQSRVIFKKSHTCGSLFAKCHCDDSFGSTDNKSVLTSLLQNSDSVCNNSSSTSLAPNDCCRDISNIAEAQVTENCNNAQESNVPENYSNLQQSNKNKIEEESIEFDDVSRKSEKSSSFDSISSEINNFPTLENIYSAQICIDHPELCLKHPEFPYPIPPKNLQTKSQKSHDSYSGKINPKESPLPFRQNETHNKRTESPSGPLSLSQIFESRDYIPDFKEPLPKIQFRDESARINFDYIRFNTLLHGQHSSGNNSYCDPDPAEVYYKESGIFGPMGNGVTTAVRKNSKILASDPNHVEIIRRNSKTLIDRAKKRSSGISEDYDYLKNVIPHIKQEAAEWEEKAKYLEAEIIQVKKKLTCRDTEILKLQREIHKLKSVLQQAANLSHDGDLLARLQEQHGMANNLQTLSLLTTSKKQGISAESSDNARKQASDIQITRHEKDFRSKQLIKDAIMDNDFLKNLDSSQVRELVESMYQREYLAGAYVIREGEAGAHLFVSASGEFEVIKDKKVLGKMGPGKAFGELAILYNCTRTASIRVIMDSKVWVLDRRVFQQIMMRTGLQRLQDNINFLRSVPLLRNLNNDVLAKIADVLEVEFYPAKTYIIRQGASGDTFFIISGGNVKVTQRLPGRTEEEDIRILQRGDYFGEQALLKEDCRTASVIALHPGVECLTVDRDSFIQLIGDLSELQEKDYGDEHRAISRPHSSNSSSVDNGHELDHIHLDDLDVIATLGVGGFGRVELVQYTYDKTQTYALKCLKKHHILETQQQNHIFSEKNIMMSCRSPFICKLYKTFKDTKYVYMLLEACLGGEVWTILKNRTCFDDHTTRFITACVIEAFEYLHTRGIIYRDLKPENLLLDARGYVKLVDFGFSKRIGFGTKTWTFCGTPEYVAPETILSKGHDRAVDYWALGILMHELLTGTPPFTASEPMKTYNLILKGIDMIDFPRHITRAAQSLIKRLCRDSPSERLGYQRGGIQDIKKHKWFQSFDWDGLRSRTMTPPIVQSVKGPTDASNFEDYGKDLDIALDDFSNWDADF